ncbi:MAG: hypothetical protein R3Y64_08745 [Peptostreptococcaceae bacterium]
MNKSVETTRAKAVSDVSKSMSAKAPSDWKNSTKTKGSKARVGR